MRFLSLIILVSLLCNSCQKTPSSSFSQQLRVNIPTDPSTLDPRKGGDITSSLFHFLLFEGLMGYDPDGKVVPRLAEHIEISEDRTKYTFTLRHALWSNGTPVTAWDFEKAWKDILHPNFPSMNAHLFYPIKNAEKAKFGLASLTDVGIRSISARVLQVTLEQPTPYFLDLVAFCVFYPINPEVEHANPTWASKTGKEFVCNGPFLLHDFRPNNQIILRKNPTYLDAHDVEIEEVQFNIVNSEITSLQMFEKGEIDLMGPPTISIPTDAIPQLAANNTLRTADSPATTFCSFNVAHPPLNNRHVRKALSYSINRKQIIENITQQGEVPALGIIPPALKKSSNTLEYFKDDNGEVAKKHFAKGLAELGITQSQFPKLHFLYARSDENHKVAQALQQQWRETLGIDVELESTDKKILLHLLKTGCYQIAQTFWMAQYNDPHNLFERFKLAENVKNYPNWENQDYTDLITNSSTVTGSERDALFDQAETLFIKEMPIAPIYHWNSAYIAQPYVKTKGSKSISNGAYHQIHIDLHEKARFFH